MTDTERKIYNKLDTAIDRIFYEMQNEMGITHGDVYPEELFELDDMEERMAGLINTMLEHQKEIEDEDEI